MNSSPRQRSDEFLKISSQFKLGGLVTESSHPVTAELSEIARRDIPAGLKLLFDVDNEVVATYREFVRSGRVGDIAGVVVKALRNGGRLFFTGCGSTGRLSILLDSIWRNFWHSRPAESGNWEDRTFSVMAGGDYALIKSVEGFEDFAIFGKQQISELGVSDKDVVFAITEGGETSFVIGTAWRGVEAGAKVYFVYNNPDAVLCANVQRSREVIEDGRIEKLNLTTGPMAITGSTRMQATTIQLCVLVTILEMAARELLAAKNAADVPAAFLQKLIEMQAALKSDRVLSGLAKIVALEESVYRSGHKNNYYADRLGIDVLTDTTERSPTYCTPPFRKFDDAKATESWSFLFLPSTDTHAAWERILRRPARCVEWRRDDVESLVEAGKVDKTFETVRRISRAELMRFRVGLDGLPQRRLNAGDSAIAIVVEGEEAAVFFSEQLAAAENAGASTASIVFTSGGEAAGNKSLSRQLSVPVPKTDFLLDGVTRAGVKMLLNALSTCTMVRLGRVMGNYMIWVVPSNLKLIDRATRYIQKLARLDYEAANRLLFEVIEYVEPRMKSDQAYPPVVGVAVLRAREGLSNVEAEARLAEEARATVAQ